MAPKQITARNGPTRARFRRVLTPREGIEISVEAGTERQARQLASDIYSNMSYSQGLQTLLQRATDSMEERGRD